MNPNDNKPDHRGYWHYVYIVRDPVTGEWYGGRHSTRKLYDNYRGSGVWLRRHPERGRLVFEIQTFCNSLAESCEIEARLVNFDVISEDVLCRNRMPGGVGNRIGAWKADAAAKEALSKHRKQRYEIEPEYREALARATAASQARWNDPEFRAIAVARQQQLWADFEYRDHCLPSSARNKGTPLPSGHAANVPAANRIKATPEWAATSRANACERWARAGFREKASAAMRAASGPERSANHAAANTQRWTDPEYKARVGAAISAARKQSAKAQAAVAALNHRRWGTPI